MSSATPPPSCHIELILQYLHGGTAFRALDVWDGTLE
jgi:hypothetical protein